MRPAINRLLPSISSANAASGVSVLCACAGSGAANSRPLVSKPTTVPVTPNCRNRRLDGTCFKNDESMTPPPHDEMLRSERWYGTAVHNAMMAVGLFTVLWYILPDDNTRARA